MQNLHVIQASAGSGKTFTLTKEFLKLVIAEPVDYFKRILAVTFTNKATAEMKERILQELHILSSGKKSAYLPELLKAFPKKTEKNIRGKSNAILIQILHNYSWFRIETIDSFFQGVIRSFIREIGIPGNYNIEIDQDKILTEAVDRFLDTLGKDKPTLQWLLEYIEQKISEGKSWTVKTELHDLGKHLFKEKLIVNADQMESFLDNAETLSEFRRQIYQIISTFENKVKEKAGQGLKILMDHGFDENDVFQGNRGPFSFLMKNASGKLTSANSYVHKVIEDPDKWPSGKCNRKEELRSQGATMLNPILSDILVIFDSESERFQAAKIVLKNFHLLALLNNLQHEITRLKKEKSIMLISDASPFIQKIIDGNDIPFIYEKIGNQFNHLLIDEFQDTSDLQWGNFKPLISNSLSENHKCLIVGDVKQSIYRWRNSKWEILAHQIFTDFHEEYIYKQNLGTNWRSQACVVQFNNLFFDQASSYIDSMNTGPSLNFIPIKEIYQNVKQQIPDNKPSDSGYISFKFFDEEDIKDIDDYFSTELIDRINELLHLNYKPGDITILVRTKSEGSEIANFLINASKENKFIQEVGIISNESLFLWSSQVVQLIVSVLKYVYKPNEKLVAAELVSNYTHLFNNSSGTSVFPTRKFNLEMVDEFLGEGFTEFCKNIRLGGLYNITEQIISRLNLQFEESDLVYLHSFLDVVFDFNSKEMSELSGFLNFWEEEGKRKTISAAETAGSIKIMTIHKSKGLEFPAVIIPFANWDFKPKSNETLWIKPESEPFNLLPLAPVNYNKALAESLFKDDFYTENYLSLVDNINLLYVAFTRAAEALICLVKKSKSPVKHLGDIIYDIISQMASKTEIEINSQNKEWFTYGNLHEHQIKTEENQEKLVPVVQKASHFPEVSISSQAIEYMRHTDKKEDAAARGRIMHALMEKVKTFHDLKPAIKTMVLNGIISNSEKDKIFSEINAALNNTMVTSWFSGEYKVLNETAIIGTQGKVKRPDRVMFNEDVTIVVDYKFGVEDDKQKHIQQVGNYVDMIKQMGYKNLKGYIWYVMENDIVEVKI